MSFKFIDPQPSQLQQLEQKVIELDKRIKALEEELDRQYQSKCLNFY